MTISNQAEDMLWQYYPSLFHSSTNLFYICFYEKKWVIYVSKKKVNRIILFNIHDIFLFSFFYTVRRIVWIEEFTTSEMVATDEYNKPEKINLVGFFESKWPCQLDKLYYDRKTFYRLNEILFLDYMQTLSYL